MCDSLRNILHHTHAHREREMITHEEVAPPPTLFIDIETRAVRYIKGEGPVTQRYYATVSYITSPSLQVGHHHYHHYC